MGKIPGNPISIYIFHGENANVSTSSTYIQRQNANEILCWMLQLTQHIQLQNTNEEFK